MTGQVGYSASYHIPPRWLVTRGELGADEYSAGNVTHHPAVKVIVCLVCACCSVRNQSAVAWT